MFKRVAFLLLLIGSVASFDYAQKVDTNDEKTNGYLNGRFWSALSDNSRLVFVVGYCEGAATAYVCPTQSQFGEIVKGIDKFYAEPENLRLPFVTAARIFAMKVMGATATEIKAVMDRARQDADSPLPNK